MLLFQLWGFGGGFVESFCKPILTWDVLKISVASVVSFGEAVEVVGERHFFFANLNGHKKTLSLANLT